MIDVKTARRSVGVEVRRVVDILRDVADWQIQTRLEGWTAADLATHLVWGQSLQADAWRRLAVGDTAPAEAASVAGADREAVVTAYEDAARDLEVALGAVTDEQVAVGTCVMPYGTLPAGLILLLAVMESGVHASDLAAAVGRDDGLSDTVVEASVAVLGATLPVLGAAGSGTAKPGTSVLLRAPGLSIAVAAGDQGWSVVTEAVRGGPSVTISGSAGDVVLFVLGRRSVDEVDVEGDRTCAMQFKDWFPGP